MEGLFVFFWLAVFVIAAYKLGRRKGRRAFGEVGTPQEQTSPRQSRVAARQSRAALEAEVDALRERLRVVERIVTERGYTLADEIEALRDARPTKPMVESRAAEMQS